MPAVPGPRSRLPWKSGAYTSHSKTGLDQFETARGRAVDSVVVFPERSSVTAFQDSSWWLDDVKYVTDRGGDGIITVPLYPQGSTLSGSTAPFQNIATDVKNAGIPGNRVKLRLGWEMNINQYWKVTSSNRTAWKNKYNAVADLFQATLPGIEIWFNPNEGGDQTGVDTEVLARELHAAGNVQGVGPDFYNWYAPSGGGPFNTDTEWNAAVTRNGGLNDWRDLARELGVTFVVPEWGGYPGSSNGQGTGQDGVFYVRKMVAYFAAAAAAGIAVSEAYFDERASYIANSIRPTAQLPALRDELKRLLAAQPTV